MRNRVMKQWIEDSVSDFLVDVIADFLDTAMPEGSYRPTDKEIAKWVDDKEIIYSLGKKD